MKENIVMFDTNEYHTQRMKNMSTLGIWCNRTGSEKYMLINNKVQ